MLKNELKFKKVIVAMSGGVDSSVAAALLKKQGFEVAGVFMRFWAEPPKNAEPRRNENLCCSEGAEKAARLVAAKLKIPFYVFNFVKEFKKEVVDYFLCEQAAGRTPNPCVVCNKKIKFGMLFQRALAMGADFLATGHYARLRREIPNSKFQIPNKIQNPKSKILYRLFTAKDKQKDQSYFLYQLNQRQLSKIIFPLADLIKEEVIKLAKKWRLPYRQEESFDLCFVANDADSFIKRHLKLKAGKVVKYINNASHPPLNLRGGEGELLGGHQGLPLYTIGQRKRLPIPQGPWWVIKKDERKNILYVSNIEQDLYRGECLISHVNWLNGITPRLPMKVWVKIRYKSEAAESLIAKRKSQIVVKFKKPQRAITPGQSAVFYAKTSEVLGGGAIK